ncbi:MAG: sugar transferase [Gemmataceae bacterium]|nr:sugar transferase [Gemmataceae bacterium]
MTDDADNPLTRLNRAALGLATPEEADEARDLVCAHSPRHARIRGAALRRLSRYLRAKWCLDLALSSLAVVLLTPFVIAAALLVRLILRRPAFERVDLAGRWGGTLRGRQLRVPRRPESVAGEDRLDSLTNSSSRNRQVRAPTRIGQFLLGTGLSRAPLLLGVLRGDWSLVGPPPDFFADFAVAKGRGLAERADNPPGLTGLHSLLTPGAPPHHPSMLAVALWYCRHAGLWLDLRILLARALALVVGRTRAARWFRLPTIEDCRREAESTRPETFHALTWFTRMLGL